MAAFLADERLYSLDVDSASQGRAGSELGYLRSFASFLNGNSVEILWRMTEIGHVGLLYLDSLGPGPSLESPDLKVPEGGFDYQLHSLREMEAAAPLLYSESVVILDDDNGARTGKPYLTKQWLRAQGWECKMERWQSVWVKE